MWLRSVIDANRRRCYLRAMLAILLLLQDMMLRPSEAEVALRSWLSPRRQYDWRARGHKQHISTLARAYKHRASVPALQSVYSSSGGARCWLITMRGSTLKFLIGVALQPRHVGQHQVNVVCHCTSRAAHEILELVTYGSNKSNPLPHSVLELFDLVLSRLLLDLSSSLLLDCAVCLLLRPPYALL